MRESARYKRRLCCSIVYVNHQACAWNLLCSKAWCNLPRAVRSALKHERGGVPSLCKRSEGGQASELYGCGRAKHLEERVCVCINHTRKRRRLILAKHRTKQGSFFAVVPFRSNARSANTSSSSIIAARRYSRSERVLPSGSRGPWAPQEQPTSGLRCSCAQGAKGGWIAGTQHGSFGNQRGVLLRAPVALCLYKSQPLKGRSTRTRTGNQLFFPSPRVYPCDLLV